MDNHFAKKDVYSIRYMDDFLILSQKRWQNRKIVRALKQILNELKLEKHPDNTFIAKIEKRFDFPGCHSRENL